MLRLTGDAGAADTDLTAGFALAAEMGAATYEAFLREEVARLHGDDAEFREALRLYRDIGATGHARRLEAELAEKAGRSPNHRAGP